MYNPDDVVVINRGDTQVGIWWGHTPYFVPPKSAVPIPSVVYRASKDHKDYADLEFLTVEETREKYDTHPDEAARLITEELQKSLDDGESSDVVPSREAPQRTVEPDADTDPDWNPLECDYDEVEAYIVRHQLIVDPDADEQRVRELVDEHMQG